jgi:hypothetical protein
VQFLVFTVLGENVGSPRDRKKFQPRDKRDYYAKYKEHRGMMVVHRVEQYSHSLGVVKWYNATKGFGYITVDDLGIDAAFQIRGTFNFCSSMTRSQV